MLSYGRKNSADPVYVGPLANCPNPADIPQKWVRITDVCACPMLMYSNGSYLIPDNGFMILDSMSSSRAAPITSKVGSGVIDVFTLPHAIKIPAYFVGISVKSVQIEAVIERNTIGTGAVGAQVRLGNANSAADPLVGAASLTASAGNVARINATVEWSDNNNAWASGAIGPGSTGGSAAYVDITSGANSYQDLYINFGFNASALAADTMRLLAYKVSLTA